MDTRTCGRKGRAALAVCLALGLAGCNTVYTVHSIAAPGNEPSTVPDVSGLWMPRDASSADGVLRVTEFQYDVGQCRDADVQWLGEEPSDDEAVADEICFIPVAGHLVLQLRTVGAVQLYHHFLVKFDEDSASICGAIWSDTDEWSVDDSRGTDSHGLRFTHYGAVDSADLIVISPRSELLSYLETRLPEAVKACDEPGDFDDWIAYVRLTPPRQPDAGGAAEEPASPRD